MEINRVGGSKLSTPTIHSSNLNDSNDSSEIHMSAMNGTADGVARSSPTASMEHTDRSRRLLSVVFDETTVAVTCRHHFKNALAIAHTEGKKELTEAIHVNPRLIVQESNPDYFIASERYNVWYAAERFIKYWKERQDIFGDRFLLPLDISNQPIGALEQHDIDFMVRNRAALVMLPPDHRGRPVLFLDPSKFEQDTVSTDSLMKSLFFSLTWLQEQEPVRTYGYVVIVFTNEAAAASLEHDDATVKKALKLVTSVFPVKLAAVHVLISVEKSTYSKANEVFHTDFSVRIKELLTAAGAGDMFPVTKIHLIDACERAWESLQAYGFKRHQLPHNIGGTLDEKDITEFSSIRHAYEGRCRRSEDDVIPSLWEQILKQTLHAREGQAPSKQIGTQSLAANHPPSNAGGLAAEGFFANTTATTNQKEDEPDLQLKTEPHRYVSNLASKGRGNSSDLDSAYSHSIAKYSQQSETSGSESVGSSTASSSHGKVQTKRPARLKDDETETMNQTSEGYDDRSSTTASKKSSQRHKRKLSTSGRRLSLTAEEREARYKARRVRYSREQREKKKSMYESLVEDCTFLQNSNDDLRREGERLNSLLECAKAQISLHFSDIGRQGKPRQPSSAPLIHGSNEPYVTTGTRFGHDPLAQERATSLLRILERGARPSTSLSLFSVGQQQELGGNTQQQSAIARLTGNIGEPLFLPSISSDDFPANQQLLQQVANTVENRTSPYFPFGTSFSWQDQAMMGNSMGVQGEAQNRERRYATSSINSSHGPPSVTVLQLAEAAQYGSSSRRDDEMNDNGSNVEMSRALSVYQEYVRRKDQEEKRNQTK